MSTYYNACVPNVQPALLLQPFFDYAFGFRRGTDAGQPPDNQPGARAEFRSRYNGIPATNERWGQTMKRRGLAPVAAVLALLLLVALGSLVRNVFLRPPRSPACFPARPASRR